MTGFVCDGIKNPATDNGACAVAEQTTKSVMQAAVTYVWGGGAEAWRQNGTATTYRQCRMGESQRGGQEWEGVARSEARAWASPIHACTQARQVLCGAVRYRMLLWGNRCDPQPQQAEHEVGWGCRA